MNQLYAGNTLDILRRDIGMFDAIISDPPYASGSTLSGKQSATSVKYTGAKKKSPYPDFCGDGMDQRAWTRMMRQVLEAAREKATPARRWPYSSTGATCLR